MKTSRPRYVAFLRAINVGGAHVVKMPVLQSLFEQLGFTGVVTFIASGNVIFEARSKDTRAMEKKIEGALERALGYEVVTFVRTLEQVCSVAKYQPFAAKVVAAAVSLNVGFLKGPLDQETRRALARLKTDIDDFHTNDAELFWVCQKGQGQSKISNAVFERTLKVKATFRGMRTMEKLAAKFGA